ncbi:unnamed protein product [Miscanthus lutarioriparius]|uniref:Bifunctional inhibitor/plant lipid transfer protein/seed storage helical domain-containing protein n=1 Tax=Miscanthus lutarioriparius TaxID=422564 RepID=A0A811NGG1_9POAL|nr:unnamed protein product [Miscanthus lutarioriparius]
MAMAMTTTTAAGRKVKVQARGQVAALSLLLVVLAAGLGGGAEAQQTTCAGQLNGLAPCLRYSVPPLPGQAPPAPGPDCCSALGAVSRDCACGTFGIINSLPAKCGLPPSDKLTASASRQAKGEGSKFQTD